MAKVRSAKGALVDFDLLKIKEQIASAPKTPDIRNREKLIDRKLRRRVKEQDKPETVQLAEEPAPETTAKPVKKIKRTKEKS